MNKLSADAKVLRIAMAPGDKFSLQTFIPAGPDGKLAFSPIGGDVAKSGELGYTFGKYELVGSENKKETGHYTHIWKRDERGRWTIVMTGYRPINICVRTKESQYAQASALDHDCVHNFCLDRRFDTCSEPNGFNCRLLHENEFGF